MQGLRIEHGLTSPPTQYIGYMGDSFYRSKDPTNSIKVLKEKRYKGNPVKAKNTQNTQCLKNGRTFKRCSSKL